jgi:DNA-directed RNA polymerase subunit H (RpoH/RPB5)
MMQQSIDGASQKIARLLDKSLSEKHNVIPKENQNNALDNFDIGDFI